MSFGKRTLQKGDEIVTSLAPFVLIVTKRNLSSVCHGCFCVNYHKDAVSVKPTHYCSQLCIITVARVRNIRRSATLCVSSEEVNLWIISIHDLISLPMAITIAIETLPWLQIIWEY